MLTAIGDVMRECYRRGWITTRDGNCSVRKTKDNKIYITPSGVRKNLVHPEYIERIKIRKENIREDLAKFKATDSGNT